MGVATYLWERSSNRLSLLLYKIEMVREMRLEMGKKKTHEEFVRDFKAKNKHFDNIELLSEYKGMKEQITCYCKICDYSWETSAHSLINGHGCPKCSGRLKVTLEEFYKRVKENNKHYNDIIFENFNGSDSMVDCTCKICGKMWKARAIEIMSGYGCKKCNGTERKTFEEFKIDVALLGNNEYTLLSNEYVNNKTNVILRHDICGYEWNVKPVNFINGNRCPKCAKKIKKDLDYFKNEVFDLVGDEYEVIGDYINTHTHILLKHKCGNIFSMTPHNFLSGQRCPKCQHRSYKKTTEEFRAEMYNLVNDEYELCSEYVNTKTRIEIKHNKCNQVYKTFPNMFLSGNRCPYCASNARVTKEEFEIRIKNSIGDNYELASDFVNMETKVGMFHKECGNTYFANPNDIVAKKSGCPYCKKSKGEDRVSKLLDEFHIQYEQQKRFADCKDCNTLPFDFYLPQYNTCIEYDGHLHYMVVDYFGGKDSYDRTVKHDNIKTCYCYNNNIDLIRIPYWDYDNIETILKDKLHIE